MVGNIASQTSETSRTCLFHHHGAYLASTRFLCLLRGYFYAPSLYHVASPWRQLLRFSDAGSKEAIIKFESDAAANTACLLNNALVDGSNIKVDLFSAVDSPPLEPQSTSPPPTNDSFTSILSGLAASGVAFAEAVATKVKDIDKEYAVSDTVIAGASTAWNESKKFVSELDEKYHIKDSMNSAVQKTKEGVTTATTSLNQKFTGSGSPKSPSPRNSPSESPSRTSPTQ